MKPLFLKPVPAGRDFLFHRQGNPEVGRFTNRDAEESLGSNADNSVIRAFDANRLAYRCGIVAVMLPPGVAGHGNGAVAGRLVVSLGQHASPIGMNAEHRKIRSGNERGVQHFLPSSGERAVGPKLDAVNGCYAGEDFVLLTETAVERVGEEPRAIVGKTVVAARRPAIPEEQQLPRLVDGKHTQHDDIHQTEDGGVGADSERERHHGYKREGGAPGQHAQAVAKVLPEILD